MRSWTILRKFRNVVAAGALLIALLPAPAPATLQTDPLALYRTMHAAFERGNRDGWHFADEIYYFSTVLDVGRAYELVRRDDPDNAVLKGYTLDLATRLHYDPLTSRDAAAWYVRLAAEANVDDPVAGERARALLGQARCRAGGPAPARGRRGLPTRKRTSRRFRTTPKRWCRSSTPTSAPT